MASLSPADIRTQIVEILNETVYFALGLKEILQDEHKALELQDMDSIVAAVDSKSACVHSLQLLDEKRIEFCTAQGFAPGPDQMPKLIEACDDGELIASRWGHLMIIAAESSAINMTNGAIIRVRQQQFESSLSLLRGVMPGMNTYGRHGGDSGDLGRQSLAEA